MAPKVDEIIDELRAKGHRITVPRHWTLKVLFDEKTHMTCEQVHQRLEQQGIHVDEATVYRTLQWLKQHRVVAQTTLGSGADVYSMIIVHQHHHLICVDCGATSELDDSLFVEMRDKIQQEYGFVPFMDHYAIFGLCPHCSDSRKRLTEAAS